MVHHERQGDKKNQTDDLFVCIQTPRQDLCLGDENKVPSEDWTELKKAVTHHMRGDYSNWIKVVRGVTESQKKVQVHVGALVQTVKWKRNLTEQRPFGLFEYLVEGVKEIGCRARGAGLWRKRGIFASYRKTTRRVSQVS